MAAGGADLLAAGVEFIVEPDSGVSKDQDALVLRRPQLLIVATG